VDANGPDGIPGTEDDDLHLWPKSPCIDAGDLASVPPNFPIDDIDGEVRPRGSRYDMGADEFCDTDGDGMPDYWEKANNLSTLVKDADADSDNDLFTNLEEFMAGTDPKDPQSKPLVPKGDIDGDKAVSLGDAIMALQLLAGADVVSTVHKRADVDGNAQIGLADVIYVLQTVARLRP
jgi:hypothetical protein